MNPKRILLPVAIALAAIAYMAPAAAQATVQLTDPAGTPLKAGAKITATSKDLTSTLAPPNAIPRLSCELVTLHLEVVANGPNHVLLKQIEGAATTKTCYLHREAVPTTLPLTITDATIGDGEENTLTINTWGTGEANATFQSHIYADAGHTILASSCHFVGKVHVQAAANENDVLSLPGSLLTATKEATCAAQGMLIEGIFTLETPNGVEVRTDFTKTG